MMAVQGEEVDILCDALTKQAAAQDLVDLHKSKIAYHGALLEGAYKQLAKAGVEVNQATQALLKTVREMK